MEQWAVLCGLALRLEFFKGGLAVTTHLESEEVQELLKEA